MKHQKCSVGYLRMNELLLRMIDAVEANDKLVLLKTIPNMLECANEFSGTLMDIAGVTDEEINNLMPSEEEDEQLLKDAGSAYQIKTAHIN